MKRLIGKLLLTTMGLASSFLVTACQAQVLVSSGDGNQVLEYDMSGTPLAGNPFASLNSPSGLAFGDDGKLYVAAYNDHTLVRYNSDGTGATTVLSNIGNVDGITLGPNGDLYLAQNTPLNSILKYDPVTGTSSVFISGLSSPLSTVFDSSGKLYVADFASGSIRRYTSTGAFDGVFASGIGDGIGGPTGIAFDSNGKLYVSAYRTGTLQRFNSNGTLDATLATLPSFGPEGIAFGPDGKLYVTETGDNGQGNDVLRYNSDGSFDETFIASGSGGLHRPLFLAFRPAAVPEPGSPAILIGLIGGGLVFLLRCRHRN